MEIGETALSLQQITDFVFQNATLVASSKSSRVLQTQCSVESCPSWYSTVSMSSQFDGLPKHVVKLLMLNRIQNISMGKICVSSSIFASLLAVCNAGIIPCLDVNMECDHGLDGACIRLLKILEGRGNCQLYGKIVATEVAFQQLDILKVGSVSGEDIRAFACGNVCTISMLMYYAIGAAGIHALSTPIAALSCEAIHANPELFASDSDDVQKFASGEMQVAQELRSMLSASKFSAITKEFNSECFKAIPRVHGMALDEICRAQKSILDNYDGKCVSYGTPAQKFRLSDPSLFNAALSITQALEQLYALSQQRVAELDISKKNNDNGAELIELLVKVENEKSCDLLLRLIKFMDQVSEAIVLEAQLANGILDEEAASIEKSKPLITSDVAYNAPEPSIPENISEEKRKKIEAKRAKKLAEKQAKELKKQQKYKLHLGLGTAQFKQKLAISNSEKNNSEFLCPFNLSSNGAIPFLKALVHDLQQDGSRRKPKIAKGAQDFLPAQMELRERIFNSIRKIFKLHGAVEIETPVFELKETLTGKYGEDSKLIYDLADQGGEQLALRYDLTVPFARFMALHNPGNIKRYHIARVYRRDNPQMARGRFREFYQCDFDIAGSYDVMIPEAEVLSVGIGILTSFPEIGPFQIKLSHRKLLDAILAACGVPDDKFRTTCSAIDKLDKETWEVVRAEMVKEKGILPNVADKIQTFMTKSSNVKELLHSLVASDLYKTSKDARQALDELSLLFDYLNAMDLLQFISFDLSLARGLDYYTGLIYEFVLLNPNNVGSIAAGGRYDNLVGRFSTSNQQIPCVGVSIGIERIFGLLQTHAENNGTLKKATTQVFVCSTTKNLISERLSLCKLLWSANIRAETTQTLNPKFAKQLRYALDAEIPFMLVVGEDEIKAGTVTIKALNIKEEVLVTRKDVIAKLQEYGCEKI